MPEMTFASDSSVLISFQGIPSAETTKSVLQYFKKIRELQHPAITELHPSYCTLLVEFDLTKITGPALLELLRSISVSETEAITLTTVKIPVYYDGEDLDEVAQMTGLSRQEVIRLHSQAEYTVAFLGFSPGFPYLLGLPEKLICPRKKTPRLRVPRGSVAIAGSQTGIYPESSPGGWQLLGRTSAELFRNGKSLLNPGDRVQFVQVETIEETSPPKVNSAVSPFIRIDNLGFYSSFQNSGHFGSAHLGVSPGGAADPLAHTIGNQLVGNNAHSFSLEMTGSGATVTFLKDTWFAVTGADCSPLLDQRPVAQWTSIPVCAGQRLEAKKIHPGLRSYLCFNQNSGNPTYKKAKDEIAKFYLRPQTVLRVTTGPQAGWFDQKTLQRFFSEPFSVSTDLNRLGVRLSGSSLKYAEAFAANEMTSEGIANGAIQVARDGQPMILFCEQRTTGGYPKIANVIMADLFRIAQLAPGDHIVFQPVSLEEAWQIDNGFAKMIQTAVYDF